MRRALTALTALAVAATGCAIGSGEPPRAAPLSTTTTPTIQVDRCQEAVAWVEVLMVSWDETGEQLADTFEHGATVREQQDAYTAALGLVWKVEFAPSTPARRTGLASSTA